MTFYNKVWEIASSVNGTAPKILFDSMKEPLRPYIVQEINKMAGELKYDGWTYDRPASEYPAMIYPLLWGSIKTAVRRFLEENHPRAWFLPLYWTEEEQKEIGLPN